MTSEYIFLIFCVIKWEVYITHFYCKVQPLQERKKSLNDDLDYELNYIMSEGKKPLE